MRRRLPAVDVADAVLLRELGTDQHHAGLLHQPRVAVQRIDEAAGELRALGHRGKAGVLLGMLLHHALRALGVEHAHPDRHRGHVVLAQVDCHVLGELVHAHLLRAVARPMHVATGAERRGEGDQPASLPHHQRRRVPARDIGRAQADVEDVHQVERLAPEGPWLDQVVVQEGRVVDEDVEAAGLLRDALEQRGHLGIVAVIAGHRDAAPAERVDLARGGVDGAGQVGVAIALRAAGHVDGGAGGAERQRDALAGAARGAGHHGHDGLLVGAHFASCVSRRARSSTSVDPATKRVRLMRHAPSSLRYSSS